MTFDPLVNRKDSQKLQDKIEAYWRARGIRVMTWVERETDHHGNELKVIRSNIRLDREPFKGAKL